MHRVCGEAGERASAELHLSVFARTVLLPSIFALLSLFFSLCLVKLRIVSDADLLSDTRPTGCGKGSAASSD